MNGNGTPSPSARRAAPWQIAFVVAMAASLFWGTAGVGFMDQDESRFAEAARVMFETGDYVSPKFNEAPRFAKPVFIYWLMCASYAVFGVNEFAARLPSGLAAVATAVVLWAFCRTLRRPHMGLLAAAVWLGWIQTTLWGRAAVTDCTLTLFITSSLLLFFLGLRTEGRRRDAAFAGAGLMVGLAFLTKGPMGLALPLFIGGVYLLVSKRLRSELRHVRLWQPALLFLLVTLPWYYLQYRAEGTAFLKWFFLFEHVERFAMGHRHESPSLWYYFYFVPFFAMFAFPFSGAAPVVLKSAWRDPFHMAPSAGHRLGRFLLLWFGIVFIGFSLSQTKNPQYIQACYPALALMAANYFDRLWRTAARPGRGEKGAMAVIACTGALFAVIFCLLPLLLPAHTRKFSATLSEAFYPVSWLLSSVMAFGTVAVVLTWLSGRRDRAFWVMVAAPWLFGLFLIRPTWPLIAAYSQDPYRRLSVLARERVPEGRSIVVPGITWSSIVHYSRRHVVFSTELAYRQAVEEEGRDWPLPREEFTEYERRIIRNSFASGQAAAVLVQDDHLSLIEGLGPWREVARDGPYRLLIPAEGGRPRPPPPERDGAPAAPGGTSATAP